MLPIRRLGWLHRNRRTTADDGHVGDVVVGQPGIDHRSHDRGAAPHGGKSSFWRTDQSERHAPHRAVRDHTWLRPRRQRDADRAVREIDVRSWRSVPSDDRKQVIGSPPGLSARRRARTPADTGDQPGSMIGRRPASDRAGTRTIAPGLDQGSSVRWTGSSDRRRRRSRQARRSRGSRPALRRLDNPGAGEREPELTSERHDSGQPGLDELIEVARPDAVAA